MTEPTEKTSTRARHRQRGNCRLLCVAAWVACVLWQSGASAWGYVEHYSLGRESYTNACKDLAEPWFKHEIEKDDEKYRRYLIACEDPSLHSNQYGQFTALSGDHLDANNTQGTKSDIAAKNFVEYLIRAVQDADHFHPAAPLKWREYHERALKAALKATGDEPYLEQVDDFWLAFYLNAFGDHFLQDSFAAGHSGFNRPSSTPSASYNFHKEMNARGKLLRDGAGREWFTFGDDHLEFSNNLLARERVLNEATASVRDFLFTFIVGKRWRQLEREVALGLPVVSDVVCDPKLAELDGLDFVERNKALDQSFENVRKGIKATALVPEPVLLRCGVLINNWKSLLQVQEPASYAITHTAGATDFGRVGKYDHVLAPTYSFGVYTRGLRFGADLGWYMSTRLAGNAGFLIAPTASFPLGGKYGSVLAWDLDLKVLALLPVTAYRGAALVQHLAPSLGLGMSLQLGAVNFRASGGPALVFSNRIGPGNDPWSDHAGLGWYGQLGIHFTFSAGGGGPMQPWPL